MPTLISENAGTVRPPRVFISYYLEDRDYQSWVVSFANQLRAGGIDARLDLYVESPPEGWPRWVEAQLAEADFIILLCTPKYCAQYLHPGSGTLRSGWEGQLIRQMLHDAVGNYQRFVPISEDQRPAPIPSPLGSVTHYSLPSMQEALYRRLTRQPAIGIPDLGTVVRLPAVPVGALKSSGAPEKLDWDAWIGFLGWLLVRLVRTHWLLTTMCCAAFLSLIIAWQSDWLRISREGAMLGAPTRLERCIQRARELRRPYAVESAIMSWRFSDMLSQAGPIPAKRKISVRTIYVLRAVRTFSEKEPSTFKEEYGHDMAQFLHWYGPEPERFQSTTGQVYLVEFGIKQGELRTVITGAEFDYDLPLPEGRLGFGSRVSLASNQEFWRYPNDIDAICELTIIIQSDTTAINPVGIGAARARGKDVFPQPVSHKTSGQLRQRSLSAHWEEILEPGDDAGIHFTW